MRRPHADVIQGYQEYFAGMPGIVSVGLGQDAAGNTVIRVLVDPALYNPQLIPPAFGGIPVEVQFSGPAKLFHAPHTGRVRPLRPGVSCIGERLVGAAGTLGGLVVSGNRKLIISCNHVLAGNDPLAVSLPVYQPSPGDSADPAEQVGFVIHYDPLELGIINRRDLAAAEVFPEVPLDPIPLDFSQPPSGVFRVPSVGEPVSKSGRSTGLTTGQVVETDAMINVDFGPGIGTISWRGTIRVAGAPFIQSGDSGAWVFDDQMNMVGMVFAGNDTGVGWLIDPLEVQAYIAEVLAGTGGGPGPGLQYDIPGTVLVAAGALGMLWLAAAHSGRPGR